MLLRQGWTWQECRHAAGNGTGTFAAWAGVDFLLEHPAAADGQQGYLMVVLIILPSVV
jgi:hypothetical protein